MKSTLNHLGGFVTGTAIAAGLILNMDDVMYHSFKRHVIFPF